MKAVLIGYKTMSGTSKKTGKEYDGVIMHLAYNDDNVNGQAVTSIYVDNSILETTDTFIQLDTEYEFNYDVSFNGYKKLVSVIQC